MYRRGTANRGNMREIDKEAMGRRIRQIRTAAGLRQWELARMLGTTQSAIHKYEHGVVPEPRRLVELSRIGGTSVEWVLTGEHWENGSDSQERLSPDVLELANRLSELNQSQRSRIDESIRIVRRAVELMDEEDAKAVVELSPHGSSLRAHAADTLQLLERAWSIQKEIMAGIANDVAARLARRS